MAQDTIAEASTVPAEFQEVFDKMDAYRDGEVSFEEYQRIPHQTLMAARQWRIQRMNKSLGERYSDLDAASGL